MRAKNLDDVYGTPVQDWTSVTSVLEKGDTQAPDTDRRRDTEGEECGSR